MPNLEWDCPHQLVSPAGTVNFNTLYTGTDGPVANCIYLVQPDDYKIVPTMRVTADNVSQQDGSVLHPRYTSGLQATIKVWYAVLIGGADVDNACGSDLRLMHEFLMVNLQSLLTPNAVGDPNTTQQLIWTPTGLGQNRLLKGIQTLEWAEVSREGQQTFVSFTVETPFPYAIDATEDDTAVGDGAGTILIPNVGDAPFFPVIEVAGTTSAFTITNEDNTSQKITYVGPTAIGGAGAEINTFDGTIYVGGSSTDLISNLSATATDFFQIQPGGTNVSSTGANLTFKTNGAYC